jgi:peroxiredoxin Q/BCP
MAATGKSTKPGAKQPPKKAPATAQTRRSPQAAAQARRRRTQLRWSITAILVLAAIGGLYAIFQHSTHTTKSASRGGYQVGTPGVGMTAPDFTLASSAGGQVSLSSYRGKSVLLYFQEGLTCQPCWDQMTALEKDAANVKAAGVDAVVSITTDPVNLITQKTRDMRLSTPVLSDPDMAVSKAYHANSYGMMGMSRDGHSFILVGPDGTIGWRADYGGAPRYTMFVEPSKILADLRAGTP